jgi:hypothetical protein
VAFIGVRLQLTLVRIADCFTAGGGPVAFVTDYCSPWMLRNAKRLSSLKQTAGKTKFAW